jgi:hypothetical protein
MVDAAWGGVADEGGQATLGPALPVASGTDRVDHAAMTRLPASNMTDLRERVERFATRTESAVASRRSVRTPESELDAQMDLLGRRLIGPRSAIECSTSRSDP